MIPDRLIEKVHLGEATEDEKRRVLADPDARARLEALPALDRAFLAAHPADELVPRIEARARVAAARDDRSRRRAALGGLVLMPLLAGALALLMFASPPTGDSGAGPEPTTAKGRMAAKLRIYRQRAGGPERIGEGTVVRAGDTLQLGIVPGGEKHAVVVSIDGRGAVTLHWPPAATAGTALGSTTKELRLPEAYELDDAPDYERFFLVADDEPIPVRTVVGAAEGLAVSGDAKVEPLPIPANLGQTSVLLRKEPR